MLLQSEKVRRAVRWISDSRKEGEASIEALVEKAISKFDLDPRQSEELMHFYRKSPKS